LQQNLPFYPMSTSKMDMPHGTGQVVTPMLRDSAQRRSIPNIKLRLWLAATRIGEDEQEYALTEQETRALSREVRNGFLEKGDPRRNLDEPWEIRISDGTTNLTEELRIRSWMAYKAPYDGHSLLIMHEMPWMEPYQPAPASELAEGGTIIAEELFEIGGKKYDVRLFIHWPTQEVRTYTLEEIFEQLRALRKEWHYRTGKHEIEVLLGHNGESAWTYKYYQYSDFPEQFIADIQGDEKALQGLDRIAVQPHKLFLHYRHHSEDYQIVAKYYGMDDYEDGYVTEREKIGERREFEIGDLRLAN